MRCLLVLLLLAAAAVPALAEGWEARGKEFALRLAEGEVRFQPPGTFTIGRPGGPEVRGGIFLWHDNWVYEHLGAARTEGEPAIDARGWLRQSGTWVIRDGVPPMKYSLAIEPAADGAVLHFETEKTAPLKLSRGIWWTMGMERKAFTEGQRVYARPTAHGKVGRPLTGECEALLVELSPGKAVSLTGEGFRELRARASDTSCGFEMNLHPTDFPVGRKAKTSLRIRFEAMPATFPGEIRPPREKLAIGKVSASAEKVAQYGKLELSVDLRATWDNPFDPDDVALDARVATASGREYTQPGFFLVDHRREVRGGVELMVPQGEGRWCVRLAAVEPGPLRCTLVAKDRSGTVTKEVGPFAITAGKAKGFLRQSRVDPRYLQFDSGAGFVPVGHNLPIYHASGQTGVDAVRKMAAKGENYNRWWMSNAGLGIEWEDRLGWYRQASAARLDVCLDLARELDFYYMLCMDTHQDYREGGWKTNPFNQANGGPCATVKEWFTGEAARTLYKKRLRYTVARWGYSPHVLCWEFGNEFEGWADTDEATKIDWHREMAAYLAKLDPYRHLISTSWWGKTGPEACWQIPEMDIVQTHCYTNNDANVAAQIRDYCLHQWARFEKPHIFGEFGIRSHSSTADKDPKGWGLHNANWAAIASGCVGIPMPWWHENYIEPLDLYFHFTAVARFVKDLPFGTERWEQIAVQAPEYVKPPERPVVRDVVLATTGKWAKPAVNEFAVQPDGSVNDPGEIHELLQGGGHKDLQNPPTFVVDYPQPGKFLIGVGRVSNSGHLKVWVDDDLALEREFPCGEKIGKEWVFREQWNLWESVYDEDVCVEIPAGKHRIKVENLGKDWMRIGRYVFTGCKVLDRPNLLVCALGARDQAGKPSVSIVWIQNRESDWFNHGRGEVEPVAPARITLDGFPAGTYQVEWWETWEGKPLRTERVQAKEGALVLLPGEMKTDIAAKIRPAR